MFVGMMMYVFFYPSSVFLNQYLQPFFESLFLIELPIDTKSKYVFNIPTAIWSFCFVFSILLISYNIDWVLYLVICLIIFPEIMQHQKLNYIPGTFDINDLIMNIFGIIMAIYLAKSYQSVEKLK
jgi:hypothetical protein|tara:strand:+ start:2332 stop:2706 length:375 start_codon:yes stop_codon:yes gene_type:complete